MIRDFSFYFLATAIPTHFSYQSYCCDGSNNYYNNSFDDLLSYFFSASLIFSFNLISSSLCNNNCFIDFIDFFITNFLYHLYCNFKLFWITRSNVDRKLTNSKYILIVLLLPSFWLLLVLITILSALSISLLQIYFIISIIFVSCSNYLNQSLTEN